LFLEDFVHAAIDRERRLGLIECDREPRALFHAQHLKFAQMAIRICVNEALERPRGMFEQDARGLVSVSRAIVFQPQFERLARVGGQHQRRGCLLAKLEPAPTPGAAARAQFDVPRPRLDHQQAVI
jgi:hypothetical protein